MDLIHVGGTDEDLNASPRSNQNHFQHDVKGKVEITSQLRGREMEVPFSIPSEAHQDLILCWIKGHASRMFSRYHDIIGHLIKPTMKKLYL